MQSIDNSLRLSASDLIGHTNCRYLTNLDLKVVEGTLAKPVIYDPALEVLVERGRRHEQGYIEHLQKKGLAVASIDGVGVDATAVMHRQEKQSAALMHQEESGQALNQQTLRLPM
jgi:uncharacterized protein